MLLQRDQLSRIKISGYKSIRECDVELKKINVLIGANGSGKSNFISAFSFLQNVWDQKPSVCTNCPIDCSFIIDEPELGLHPFAITVLLELIQSASVWLPNVLGGQTALLPKENFRSFSPDFLF